MKTTPHQEPHLFPKDLSVNKARGILHWLQDDFPYWFQHYILGVVVLESQIDDRKGDEKSEQPNWSCESSSQCFHKYAAFLGTYQPIFLRGVRNCAFSMFQHILAANKYNCDHTLWFDQCYTCTS